MRWKKITPILNFIRDWNHAAHIAKQAHPVLWFSSFSTRHSSQVSSAGRWSTFTSQWLCSSRKKRVPIEIALILLRVVLSCKANVQQLKGMHTFVFVQVKRRKSWGVGGGHRVTWGDTGEEISATAPSLAFNQWLRSLWRVGCFLKVEICSLWADRGENVARG